MKNEAHPTTYLTFITGEELFAFDVLYVQEILDFQKITPVPESPKFMRGIINLRGNILPVIDTRNKLGLPKIEDSSKMRIIVIKVTKDSDNKSVGMLVDSVTDVIEIKEGSVLPPPNLENKTKKSDFITGVINKDNDFIMVLDTLKIFTNIEKQQIAQ